MQTQRQVEFNGIPTKSKQEENMITKYICSICGKPMEEMGEPTYLKEKEFDLGMVQTYKCKKCGVWIKEVHQDYNDEQMEGIQKKLNKSLSFDKMQIVLG